MRVLLLADNFNPWHCLTQIGCARTQDATGLCFGLGLQPHRIALYHYASAWTLFVETLRAKNSRGYEMLPDVCQARFVGLHPGDLSGVTETF